MRARDYQTGAILLEATTPSLNANAEFGVTDESRLKNPHGTPILIDEIRFNVQPANAAGSADRHVAGDLRVQLKLGRVPLTNGFVPIWSLCLGVNQTFGANAEQVVQQSGDRAVAPSLYTWHLPKPLYVPTGGYLDPLFQNAAVHFNTAKTCRIVYAGRVLSADAPIPEKIHVPWATAFVGASKAAGTDTTEQSREHHLVNPFDVPLKVQRFIGRLAQVIGSFAEAPSAGAVDAALQLATIRMVDSGGRIVIRDPTPFNHVFSIKDRAWTVNAVLPPRGFYVAYFDERYSSLSGNAIQVFLSMIGHRTVPFEEYA